MNGLIREWIEYTAQAIEVLAVGVMVAFIVIGTIRWLSRPLRDVGREYQRYRVTLGKSLLVGLELLVAADIIRTVTLDSTLEGIAGLGALVAVRTALSWTLTVEVEGRWPWQSEASEQPGTAKEAALPDSRSHT